MPPFSRGFSYICTFCRHVSSSAKRTKDSQAPRELPRSLPARHAHAPKDNTKLSRSRKVDEPVETPTNAKLPFSFRQRIRLARFTPKILREHPTIRSFLFGFFTGVPITGFLLLHFPFDYMNVNGPSMSPTFNPSALTGGTYDGDEYGQKDSILVQKWSPNDWRERNMQRAQLIEHGKWKRGQIVVFHMPHDPEQVAVKRIIGLPGDRVRPLKGYGNDSTIADEEPEPVVVQYNHVWVEGDVNDRNKSRDSNWYGPISQNLIIGEVKLAWRPWWKPWTANRVDWRTESWPAKKMNRVEEGVVVSASINPDVVHSNDSWTNGQNESVLKLIVERPEFALKNFEHSEKQRAMYRQFYYQAILMVRGSEDRDKKNLAAKIILAMEDVFGKETLREGRTVIKTGTNGTKDNEKKRERWRPSIRHEQEDRVIEEDINNPQYFGDANVHEEEGAKVRQDKLRPAQAALRKMIEQNKYLADQKEHEMEHRDQQREAKEGVASSWSLQGLMTEGRSESS